MAAEQPFLLRAFKTAIVAVGALCLLFGLAYLPPELIGWKGLLIVIASAFIIPRLSLTVPRSGLAINFSDFPIFLAFLLFGVPAAIVIAVIETFAHCLYLRSRGFPFARHMIPVNVSMNAIATAATCWVVSLAMSGMGGAGNLSATPKLISLVGMLAFSQFVFSLSLTFLFSYLKEGAGPLRELTRNYFSSLMSNLVGAGLAGLSFKLLNYGDLVTALVAAATLFVILFTYRQSISDINKAFDKVEEAERQKAEAERERAEAERKRRREAESYAGELAKSLAKEAQANAALRKSEQDFQYAALHDSLTGLANRKYLGDLLSSLLDQHQTDPGTSFQVLFLDIRGFKNINDSLGHSVGDKVLQIAAKRFERVLNPNDTVARIGGDEFAIILRGLATTSKAQKVARRIYRSITQPFSLGGNKISIDVNIGIAPCDMEYSTPEEILRDADIAMHYAKERNDGPAVFTKELRTRFLERVRLEMDLRQAIDRKELSLHYQPIITLADGRIMGFEALLRWQHSEYGMVPPHKFIPIAEASDLIQPITVWILRETTRQIAEWQKIYPDYADLVVSVNISGRHLRNDDLIEDVEAALEASGIDPFTLKLEITESTAMENAEHTINILRRLKNIGVQLSIDDFGTGYSSLSYLHRLPFDTLKIDRSFVNNVGEKGENSGILQTIVSLAKNLNMRAVAEGIETETQMAVLRNLGCEFAQGYLFAKPKGKDETEKLLYERQNLIPTDLDEEYHPSEELNEDAGLPVF
ncbi:MAG TPA: EAL domain-containing protein [Pyrinomonadaceae bacterium]|nr:EAL domain-containing protein [Pyrinomonadaceae bacterium]HMP64834.1 EAL domain-containing protein [Pyrinomonadaceae bacterium]